MNVVPPPIPASRREPLLRGPLIVTAISRVVMIPLYFLCALATSRDLKIFIGHFSYYLPVYIADKFALVFSLWSLLMMSVLLAWLFFWRHPMFRPLMIYFSFLPLLLFVGVVFHTARFQQHHHTHAAGKPLDVWIGFGVLFAMVLWPFYYIFSPRVKRVFKR